MPTTERTQTAGSTAPDEKPENEALSDRVRRILRDDLIAGRYKPGEKIKIRRLATKLGVSPTPVREAVQLLIAAGALDARPNHTVTVASPGPTEYREINRMRMELEGLAAHDAALYRSDTQLRDFIAVDEQMEKARAAGQFDEVLQCNRRLHFALADMAGMTVMQPVLEGLWLRVGPTFNLLYQQPENWPVENPPHSELVDALVRQDAEQARAAIQRDIRLGTDVVLRKLWDRPVTVD